jgi:hypothetical protein
MHTHEMYACEMHARKVHAYETHAHEVHAYEMLACKVHAYETHARMTSKWGVIHNRNRAITEAYLRLGAMISKRGV